MNAFPQRSSKIPKEKEPGLSAGECIDDDTASQGGLIRRRRKGESHMKKWVTSICLLLVVVGMAMMSSGCAAFRASATNVNVDETGLFDARYDAADMRNITKNVVD